MADCVRHSLSAAFVSDRMFTDRDEGLEVIDHQRAGSGLVAGRCLGSGPIRKASCTCSPRLVAGPVPGRERALRDLAFETFLRPRASYTPRLLEEGAACLRQDALPWAGLASNRFRKTSPPVPIPPG